LVEPEREALKSKLEAHEANGFGGWNRRFWQTAKREGRPCGRPKSIRHAGRRYWKLPRNFRNASMRRSSGDESFHIKRIIIQPFV